jgi:cellulose synthase/poly-beta-1,6-N-acetylglucosamine synthase-like glycosyltransferase
VLYTYLGFPLLIALRALLWPQRIKRDSYTPTVSLILPVHNEAAIITAKLDNTFALDYPRTHLEVIVASDGSNDGTHELVAQYEVPGMRLLELPRQGKNRTINAAVTTATGDVLVFTDADNMLAPKALRYLVAPFCDPTVGGVSGDYGHAAQANKGIGERVYWSLERKLKRLQSRAGSVTSAAGPNYAIRRHLFTPIPVGVNDDFFTSVQVHAAHYRLIFEPRSVACGPVEDSPRAEFCRKVRIITGGLRAVWQVRHLLNPVAYGFFAVQLLSHKLLRRLMVLPLTVLAVAAPLLWMHGWPYKLVTMSQLGLHGFGLLGLLLCKTHLGRLKGLRLPFFFALVNLACLVALYSLLRRRQYDMWIPQRSGVDTSCNESRSASWKQDTGKEQP